MTARLNSKKRALNTGADDESFDKCPKTSSSSLVEDIKKKNKYTRMINKYDLIIAIDEPVSDENKNTYTYTEQKSPRLSIH